MQFFSDTKIGALFGFSALAVALVVASRSTSFAQDASSERSTSVAQEILLPDPMDLPAPAAETDQPYKPQPILPGGLVIPLYPRGSDKLDQKRINKAEQYDLSQQVHGRIKSIVSIHNPSIEIHFAAPNMNTGAVVILAAGGGHRTLNVGTESADFVPFFYNYGVNTAILRNRLRSDGYDPRTDAVNDALQSIRLVRKFADLWNIDPQKIGIMGFSAGAELSSPAAVSWEEFDNANNAPSDPLTGVSSRPDFVGIIYPGPTPFAFGQAPEIPKNAPPAFITCAGAGDAGHARWANEYFAAMLDAGIPNVEMHIYGNGFHPGSNGATGGMTHRKGDPFGKWHLRFIEWFDDLGFLNEPGVQTKAAQDTSEFVNRPPRRRGGFGRRGQRQRGPGADAAQLAAPESGQPTGDTVDAAGGQPAESE